MSFTRMTGIVAGALLALAGGADAHAAGCRPDGATRFDADRSGGTLYVLGRAPTRTLVACRTAASPRVIAMRENATRRFRRARAGSELGVVITRGGGRDRITAFTLGAGTIKFWVRAAAIRDERVRGRRVAWIERGRRLRLYGGEKIVTVDDGAGMRAPRLDDRAVSWRQGGGSFSRHFGSDPCRPRGASVGPHTEAVKTFSVAGPNPDGDDPAELLYACDPERQRSVLLYRAAGEGLAGESVDAVSIAGPHVLYGSSGGNQYASWFAIGVGDVKRGRSTVVHSDYSMMGGPYQGAGAPQLNASGDVAFFTTLTYADGRGGTTGLVVHDGQGKRTLDTGSGLADLALDATTVRWTKNGVPSSATLRR